MSVTTGPADAPDLHTLLHLETIDQDLFRSTAVFDDPYPLYGGQVAAQALLAAGRTVEPDRLPHSIHGYYLRPGSAARGSVLRVERDRDGRSFSARRVVAIQGGEVVFSMAASFQRAADPDDGRTPGRDETLDDPPSAPPPEQASRFGMPRLSSVDCRAVPGKHSGEWPTRFWARCRLELPEQPLVHAAVLTYLSDISSGLAALHDDRHYSGPSLDHALWFHRPVRLDDWVLVDLVPRTVAAGRGFYDGTVHGPDRVLAASLTQETLFRRRASC